MEKLDLDIDDDSSLSSPGGNPEIAQEHIQLLVHACECRDESCCLPSCQRLKRVVQHTKICKRKTNGGCIICKQFKALCSYHAKDCQDIRCLVPVCISNKNKHKQQQLQQRLHQFQQLRRRWPVARRPSVPSDSQSTSQRGPSV